VNRKHYAVIEGVEMTTKKTYEELVAEQDADLMRRSRALDVLEAATIEQYAVIEDDGRLQIVQGWTLIAEMNEDRNGYVDPDLGRRQWAAALERAHVMVAALNAALMHPPMHAPGGAS